jgi:hypothetical protein
LQDFVDLQGASGPAYRFRLWPEGAPHSPMAGNYAYLREEAQGFTVLLTAASDDLSRVRANWARAVAKHGATHLYTRLNVSASVREAEQEDIAAHYKPSLNRQTA